jgi:phenylacetate-CoA ligase
MIAPFSLFPETQWPAIPSPYAAGLLAVLFQLEHTQWLSADDLTAQQFRQLSLTLNHAYQTVPFYRARLDASGVTPTDAATVDGFRRLPFLTRRDIQTAGSSLHSTAVPKNHGELSRTTTGGSTGQPVTVVTTGLTEFFWRVFTLRDHIWHHRDFSQPFAAIRYTDDDIGCPPAGTYSENWGTGARNVIPTGPGYLLNVKSTIKEQADWLRHVNPAYVMGYPSALYGIARVFEEQGCRIDRLRQVLTFGEVLEPERRSACERAFGVKLVDMYSSQELGYIAFQCPDSDQYHVQAENLLVEVLDETSQPCRPGQIGKIVITTLHNFAMPLLRYDIGDFAEVGQSCPCGRGLPVLKRIVGRQRNLLVMPDGELRWPVFISENETGDLPPFFQFQVVQLSLEELQLNVVRPTSDVTPEEHRLVEAHFQRVLGYPFKVAINCVAEIPRSPSGKFEDFISHVHQPR